jgi:antitoxin CptB
MINDREKIKWKLRRGMLELDLMLSRFFEHDYAKLEDNEKQTFLTLLSLEDDVLFRFLMGYDIPNDESLLELIQKIQRVR